ncbi:MAG: hypothetical protein M1833_006818 [Piccolia ochrophora]|nr:MAG: hypothetical protein M1833_006818 [Piccolia ochrophora]
MPASSIPLFANLRNTAGDGAREDLDGVTSFDVPSDATAAAHEARLDRALKELQDRVGELGAALEKLRKSSSPSVDCSEISSDPSERLRQLHAIKTTYEKLTHAEPVLPSTDSPLPALLALRTTSRLIDEIRSSIADARQQLSNTRERLEKEEADLQDARLVAESLEKRTEALRAQQQAESQTSPTQLTRNLVKELQARKTAYERETKRLVKAFNKFIDKQLAAMLAAEELGGPIVGEMLEISDEMLGAGFSHQGKVKKIRNAGSGPGRQRRIDEVWGQNDSGERSEREAAGAEMRALTEDLLNASAMALDGTASGYVELRRESAAARFLVRAKVAQFHPKDARRLRLIDFGRDLDE